MAEIFPSFKWVFPTSKLRYSAQHDYKLRNSSFAEALKGEEIISQWFDVWDIQTPKEKEELMIPGLQESIKQIMDLVEEEAQSVPLERIILGGISQGCATAILTLLSSGMHLGGFIGLCSWLPFEEKIVKVPVELSQDVREVSSQVQRILGIETPQNAKDDQPRNNTITASSETSADTAENSQCTSLSRTSTHPVVRTPIFLAHAHDDEIVPFSMGTRLQKGIRAMGFDVIFKEYHDGGHWIHPREGVDDISAFLHDVLGLSGQ